MIKDISNWFLSVQRDFIVIGTTEDGQVAEAEVYFIQAQYKDGRRLQHNWNWITSEEKHICEEGEHYQYYTDTRIEDKAAAEILITKIKSAGCKIDLVNWMKIQPAYGSEAYAHDPRWEENLKQYD
jgi:hypothetical protein